MASSTPRRPFELVANHIVLDFVNTVNARPAFTRDDLAGPDDVVDWARATGLLDRNESMERRADKTQFLVAIDLREQLYGVFGPIAAGAEPPDAGVRLIAGRAAAAIAAAQWARLGESFQPNWRVLSIAGLCDRLADEALQLLRSPAVARINACDGCGWLFLDTSRGHARRWCSMNACGARHKMRRYHQRKTTAVSG